MNLKLFKLDIDDLINEFIQCESSSFNDMKQVWLSKKFSFLYEASPTTNLALFMQSLYAHCIGYMVCPGSFSKRLAGLYCLYCLYETQPFKPPFKIYLSLGELKKLKDLVADAKANGAEAVPVLVKRMMERNEFLFGSVDLNENAVNEILKRQSELQNARIKLAYERLFGGSSVEHFVQNLGMEVDLNSLTKMSCEYEDAKKRAIDEASGMVDVENMRHFVEDDRVSAAGAMAKIIQEWDQQRQLWSQKVEQSGHDQALELEELSREKETAEDESGKEGENETDFCHELELQLFEGNDHDCD